MFNWENGVVVNELPALVGIILFLSGYLFVHLGKIEGQGFFSALLNAVATGCVLFSIGSKFEDKIPIVGLLVIFLAISVFGIARQSILTRRVIFSAEEQAILDAIAPGLAGGQARQLLDLGYWTNIAMGSALTVRGQMNTHLYFLRDGAAEVTIDDRRVNTIGAMSLVGEISFFSGTIALASVTATEDCDVYAFESNTLSKFLAKNASIRNELESRVSRQISTKLNRANRLFMEHTEPNG